MSQQGARGALVGAALGDALGAWREGGPIGTAIWTAITACVNRGRRRPLRWTDDTQQTLVLARRLIADGGVDCDALARDWAAARQWWRGYGRGMSAMLRRVSRGTPWRDARTATFADGSFGNGGAMRAAPIGLFYGDDVARDTAAREVAAITHAHPRGVEGGALVAHATALALRGIEGDALLGALADGCREQELVRRIAQSRELELTPRALKVLGSGVLAHTSVPVALCLGARCQDWDSMIATALRLGGDTDTVATMAGAVFGARRGLAAIPDAPLEARDEILALADALHERAA